MQGLFRRPSGIYFLRISVPKLLRNIFGKCEVIDSTGTTELAIAKMVAGSQAAQWRQHFFNAGRLSSLASLLMTNDQELIRIAQGHPTRLLVGAAKPERLVDGTTDRKRAQANQAHDAAGAAGRITQVHSQVPHQPGVSHILKGTWRRWIRRNGAPVPSQFGLACRCGPKNNAMPGTH